MIRFVVTNKSFRMREKVADLNVYKICKNKAKKLMYEVSFVEEAHIFVI